MSDIFLIQRHARYTRRFGNLRRFVFRRFGVIMTDFCCCLILNIRRDGTVVTVGLCWLCMWSVWASTQIIASNIRNQNIMTEVSQASK